MRTRYFPGFNFTRPVYNEEPGIEAYLIPVEFTAEERERERSLDIKVIEICADEISMGITCNFLDSEVGIDYDITTDFSLLLAKVSKRVKHRFDMKKRKLVLVHQEELKPKTFQDENRLVDRYGEYMRNGGGGDCTQNSDGSFLLRVGINNNGISTRTSVIDTSSHEYGHTLGRGKKSLSPVFEELKAYAFASLCERVDLETFMTSYEDPRTDLHPNRVHELAIHRLTELLRAGVSEVAILSHLTGENIGKVGPESYLEVL